MIKPEPAELRIVRSSRRRRTITARRRDGVIEVVVPLGMRAAEEAMWVERMRLRIERAEAGPSDEGLALRARALSRKYFSGELRPVSVRWSEQQQQRWGSCTVDTGAIRLSARMQNFPAWVVDYVLVHELAHLRYQSHGPRFWSLVNRYPLTERARGYLIAKGGEAD
ncbi:MAG: M48 metallopeptidase family protein [Candidatus Dormibacteria bacterium]